MWAFLMAWLGAGAAAAASGPAAPPAPTVDILTLNTWGLPYPLAWVDRARRFPGITRFVHAAEADLVGLQEVWRGAERLLDLPGRLHRRGTAGDTGLALVSPHPVSAVEERHFRAARGADVFKQKGALSAVVTLPGVGPVQVVVTHLQAGSGPANAAVRAAQVDELLGTAGREGLPVVLLGDFNFDPRQPADRAAEARLADGGWVDAAAALGRGAITHPGDGQRYDRVYLPPALTPVAADTPAWAAEAPLSDHLPVWVRAAPPAAALGPAAAPR